MMACIDVSPNNDRSAFLLIGEGLYAFLYSIIPGTDAAIIDLGSKRLTRKEPSLLEPTGLST